MATQQPPSANMTLENFTNYFIESIYDSPVKYKIINSTKTTLAGKDAEDVTMYEYLDDRTSKVKRIISLYDNYTAYMIKYGAEPGKFSKYLPVAQRMIDSFIGYFKCGIEPRSTSNRDRCEWFSNRENE